MTQRSPASPSTTPAPKRRKWLRRLVLGSLLAVTLVIGGGIFFTQGPGVGWVIQQAVGPQTGCDVSFSSARLRFDGSVVIHDVVLHARHVPGPGGDLMRAERVLVFLDWTHWKSGEITPTGVEVIAPVLRLSQDPQGLFNVSSLRSAPVASASPRVPGPSPTAKLPFMRAVGGSIELGEHTANQFTPLARLPVEGSITPIGRESGTYAVAFAEVPITGAPSDSAMRIDGLIDLAKGEGHATLAGLDLQKWTPETVPGALRREFRELALDGMLAGASVHFAPDTGLVGEIQLKGVAVSIPVPSEHADPKNAPRVRMHGVTGAIRLSQGGAVGAVEGLEANLSGMIEDLPCTINLRTAGFNPDDATIDCEVLSEGFQMSKTWALRAFAPELVLMRLEQFSGPTAVVDARAKVRREKGNWTSRGSVLFREGRAAFAQFPYPFYDLSGKVEFDDEAIRIVGITGTGITGAKLVAEGRIWPPSDGDNVEIRVDVTNAPIDEVLAAAIDANRDVNVAALAKIDDKNGPLIASGKVPNVFEYLLGSEQAASLRAGAESWRGGLYKALFSESKYAALRRDGLVIDPAEKADLRKSLAAIDHDLEAADLPADRRAALAAARDHAQSRLDVPEFTFGGRIDQLIVTVKREPGGTGFYKTDIDIRFDSAGMVPEPFPLPIRAQHLLVKVREDDLAFEGKGFTGLRGGVAEIEGVVDTTDPDRTAKVPRMKIIATGLPVDDLLIRAIPERMSAALDPADEALRSASAPAILSALGVTGIVDTIADVRQLPDGHAGFDVTVKLAGLEARPHPTAGPRDASAGVALSNLTGTVHVTHQLLEVPELSASVHAGASDTAASGTLRLHAKSEFANASQHRPGKLSAEVDADNVDLAWSVEDLVGAFSGEAASTLARLRREHAPSGPVDASVRIEPGDPEAGKAAPFTDQPLRVTVDVRRAAAVQFDVLGGRLGAGLLEGNVGIRIDTSPDGVRAGVAFDHARGSVTFDGSPAGLFTLHGPVGVDDQGRLKPAGPLDVTVASGKIESGLTRAIVSAAVSQGVGDWIRVHELAGEFDAALHLTEKPAKATPAAPTWAVSGTVEPKSFGITRRGVRTDSRQASGRAVIAGREIRLEDLVLATPDWTSRTSGLFSIEEDEPRWSLEATVAASGSSLPPSLLSLLPDTVGAAVNQTSVKVEGAWTLPAGKLTVGGLGEPITRASFQGELSFQKLSADVGVALSDASGTLVVDAKLPEGAESADVRLDISAPSLLAAGIPLTDAGTVITTGKLPGEVLAPTIFGRCSGGALSGTAWVRTRGAGPARDFGARLELGGVHLGDMLAGIDRAKLGADLALGVAEPKSKSPSASGPQATPGPTPERGILTAQFAVGGIVGDPPSRRGRGSLTIDGGDVVGVPLMAQMLELSNMIPPMGDKLNYLQASFYLEGPKVTFEELRLQSGTVEVIGAGTMQTPGMELDLTFNSRGRARVPIWSDLLEGLRDEFITTTVKGTLRDPVFASESLRGTKSLFSGIFGPRQVESPRPGPPGSERAAVPEQ